MLLLESQKRVGGRIHTLRANGEIIELGAEFIHGLPPELVALVREAGLELMERSGATMHSHDGALIVDDDTDDQKGPFDLLEQLKEFRGGDLSFAEFLDVNQVPLDERSAVIGFVEGFNAADQHVISARALGLQQKAEQETEGDRSFHVLGGYDQLPDYLARQLEELGGQVRLDTRVDRIEWQPNRVVLQTNQGTFTASKVVITLPLGVLQSGRVEFHPKLPQAVSDVLARRGPVRSGKAVRFTLIFREPFWQTLSPQPEMGELSFLINGEAVPPVWWTSLPEKSNALTGWIGGPRAERFAGWSAEALAELGCDTLAGTFHLESTRIRSMLIGCYTHDWSADPHAQGAYSYIAKGGLEAPGVLSQPVADTLYFAGEHTATDGHWGTVHAALASGLRAAGQISASMSDRANTNPATAR